MAKETFPQRDLVDLTNSSVTSTLNFHEAELQTQFSLPAASADQAPALATLQVSFDPGSGQFYYRLEADLPSAPLSVSGQLIPSLSWLAEQCGYLYFTLQVKGWEPALWDGLVDQRPSSQGPEVLSSQTAGWPDLEVGFNQVRAIRPSWDFGAQVWGTAQLTSRELKTTFPQVAEDFGLLQALPAWVLAGCLALAEQVDLTKAAKSFLVPSTTNSCVAPSLVLDGALRTVQIADHEMQLWSFDPGLTINRESEYGLFPATSYELFDRDGQPIAWIKYQFEWVYDRHNQDASVEYWRVTPMNPTEGMDFGFWFDLQDPELDTLCPGIDKARDYLLSEEEA
ncbi:hypothetical protein BSR28_01360 [Boudabousia liubingyangii]|uniref:hypothetical protein n=1 Tax=Boudabousia liubingyangii TaxID=1921764 RepID=UPI00094004D9|nr:hypothetical protein [Boudabousia liubingyangii]OKL48378.1 hypothetical protein BSR28_01360 [Boudabousia liubingyangii]